MRWATATVSRCRVSLEEHDQLAVRCVWEEVNGDRQHWRERYPLDTQGGPPAQAVIGSVCVHECVCYNECVSEYDVCVCERKVYTLYRSENLVVLSCKYTTAKGAVRSPHESS